MPWGAYVGVGSPLAGNGERDQHPMHCVTQGSLTSDGNIFARGSALSAITRNPTELDRLQD